MGMRLVVHLMGYELVLLFINRYRGGRVCYCKTEVGEVVVELYVLLWVMDIEDIKTSIRNTYGIH